MGSVICREDPVKNPGKTGPIEEREPGERPLFANPATSLVGPVHGNNRHLDPRTRVGTSPATLPCRGSTLSFGHWFLHEGLKLSQFLLINKTHTGSNSSRKGRNRLRDYCRRRRTEVKDRRVEGGRLYDLKPTETYMPAESHPSTTFEFTGVIPLIS